MATRKTHILVLNAGSATLKWSVFSRPDLQLKLTGSIDQLHHAPSILQLTHGENNTTKELAAGVPSVPAAMKYVVRSLETAGIAKSSISVIGHRVVHGGFDLTKTTKITTNVFSEIKKLTDLAPLHNPSAIDGIASARRLFPRAQQVAAFDTAFFASMPVWTGMYALPYHLNAQYRIRRYGFHGLSHQYVATAAAEQLGRPLDKLSLITCHLGSGASIAAILHGRPIDTSMGFTPLEGLVMGTRSGDIDPGLVTYLAQKEKLSPAAMERLLNHESGLKGMTGFSDMRDVLAAAGLPVSESVPRRIYTAQQRNRAQLAIEVYVYRIQKYIGAYATILGGCDALVFTGAVGEQSEVIREMIRSGIRVWRNLRVLVIPTDEAWMIAQEAHKVTG